MLPTLMHKQGFGHALSEPLSTNVDVHFQPIVDEQFAADVDDDPNSLPSTPMPSLPRSERPPTKRTARIRASIGPFFSGENLESNWTEIIAAIVDQVEGIGRGGC